MTELLWGQGPLLTLAGPNRPRVGEEMRELGIIQPWVMLIEDGSIAQVGHLEDLVKLPAEKSTEVKGCVLPAFVDAHTHAFIGQRWGEFEMRAQGESYEAIAAAGGGILSTMRAMRDAAQPELLDTLESNFQSRTDTAAFEVKSGYGLSLGSELRILRLLKQIADKQEILMTRTFLGAHAVPPEFSGQKQAYMQHVIGEMLPAVAQERLADSVDMFVEDGFFSHDDARSLSETATPLGMRLRLHVDQLGDSGGAELAAELGAWTADHLEHTTRAGMLALKAASVIPVLLPASAYYLRKGFPDARQMIELGLPVVLATDHNPGTSPCRSLPFVANLACTQMGMLPSEALTAITVNAAHACGFQDSLGSLEPGKLAKLNVVKDADWRSLFYAL